MLPGSARLSRSPPPRDVTFLPTLSDAPEEGGDADACKYIVYTSGRKVARLHLGGGCWRARRLDFREVEILDTDVPDTGAYNRVCKDCWPRARSEEADSEDSESNSGSSGSMTP